jgi:hypothetical protein
VVEIEQDALRALEQDVAAGGDGVVDEAEASRTNGRSSAPMARYSLAIPSTSGGDAPSSRSVGASDRALRSRFRRKRSGRSRSSTRTPLAEALLS